MFTPLLPFSAPFGSMAIPAFAPRRAIFSRRFNKLLLLPVLYAWIAGMAQPAVAQTTITWTTAASQQYANSEAQGVAVNGRLYVFGGFDVLKQPSYWTPTNRAYVYNPATNTWSPLANMPPMNGTAFGGVTHAGLTTDGTNIYFAGGYTSNSAGTGQIFGTKEVWRYNVAANTYTRLPDLPVDRASGQLAYLNGELHHIGGTNKARTMDVGDHYVLSLQPLGTSWRTAAALPNPRHHAGAAVLNGKIYYIGGQRGHDGALTTQADVHVWDPANPGVWSKVQGLPRSRGHISASTFVFDNRIFVIGGEIAHGTSVRDVTAYNPATNSWATYTGLPAARASGVAAALGNTLYYTTGSFSRTTYKGALQVTAPSGGCNPVSTLPCPQTKAGLPVSLDFNGGTGSLTDKNGAGTGFTMADNPSARLAVDGTPTYPNVPGYEPSKLAQSGGRLQITTNKGLAYLKPSLSSETNSQINALGVGFLSGGKFTVETTLVNPYASAKTTAYFEQGGLWFGLNEDNFVKLVVVALQSGKHQIELRKEVNAASAGTDGVTRTNLSLGNTTVKLTLEADPAAGTVRGLYSVNGGAPVTVGTLSVPASFFSGKTLSDNATKATFAGIYASHRRASTPVVFTFENFKITPVSASTPAAMATRINAGGTAYTSTGGNAFSADAYASGGSVSRLSGGEVANTADDVLYRSNRWGGFSYNLPTGNGTFDVILHFAETYWGNGRSGGVGSRKFHVNMEGSRKLTDYDIFAKAGGAMRAVRETFRVGVADGTLNIGFLRGAADNALISAIEVIPVTTASAMVTSDERSDSAGHTHSMEAVDGQLRPYPNPVTDVLHLQLSFPGSEVRETAIMDAAGKTRLHNAHTIEGESLLVIRTGGLAKGLYVLRLQTDGGARVIKFVKL